MKSPPFDDGSRKHHYVPEFYIRGFANREERLYRYDKVEDNTEYRTFSPSQVFFRHDDNTSFFKTQRITIAEQAYAALDSEYASRLNKYRTVPVDMELNTPETSAIMFSVALNFFFRVPANEPFYRKLFDSSEFIARDKEGNDIPVARELMMNEDFVYKMYRPFLPQNILGKVMRRFGEENKMTSKIIGFARERLVLSDNPVVYAKYPENGFDLVEDFMLPISASRLFANHSQPGFGKGDSLSFNYNALAIEQAERFVCSGDKVMLCEAVENWKALRESKDLPSLWEGVFQRAFEE